MLSDSAVSQRPGRAEVRTPEAVANQPRPDGLKRCMDLLAAPALLLALSPLLALIALALKLDSPGPVLFRQRRLGLRMQPFTVLKFRTMRADAPSALHETYIAQLAGGRGPATNGLKKLTDDPRVTRVGAILRRTSLDELPQLLNVVAGHMSLVGPRPAIDYELVHYAPEHYERFAVRPGLTGLWQVLGRSELGFLEMLDLDVEYARLAGLGLDARILLRTPRAVARRTA